MMLAGVRVLDLSRILAGPFATQALAQLGADVVKVEPPEGDPSRRIGPFINGRSLYFSSLNTGKRSVVIDLKTPPGVEQFHRLLAGTEIVVENFRPEAARRLELDPQAVVAAYPEIVWVSIPAFRSSSARADDPGYDLIAQAESGIMSLTGEPGGPPVRAGVAISDLAAGLWAALGGVAAYARRMRDGHGSHVEVPLLDAALSLLSYTATGTLAAGRDPVPVGSGHHNIVPYRAFATRDGWVVVAVLGDKFWPRLCAAIGRDDLASRPDLGTNAQREAARAEVDALVEEGVGRLTTVEAMARLGEADVPHAPINSVLDALRAPYVRERGLVRAVGEGGLSYQVVQGPLRDGRRPQPAPAVGEHTAEIMTAVLGAGSSDLAAILG